MEFTSPCIIAIPDDSNLAIFLNEFKIANINLNINPFELRKNNYFILEWPIKRTVNLR